METLDRIRQALRLDKLKLPARPSVREIRVEDYMNYAGDDALRVDVILVEDEDVETLSGRDIMELSSVIQDELLRLGDTRFPYIFFAKQSELDELDNRQAAND